MVPEIHKIKVNKTLLVHSQFGIKDDKTVVHDGQQNLYFRYDGKVYKFSRIQSREKTPNLKVFYFTPEIRKFNLENPHLVEGTFIEIEIFTK